MIYHSQKYDKSNYHKLYASFTKSLNERGKNAMNESVCLTFGKERSLKLWHFVCFFFRFEGRLILIDVFQFGS